MSVSKPVSIGQFAQWKLQGRKITVLTAWDAVFAEILDQAGVEMILVGDSLAMVALGHPTTLPLDLDDMIHHAQAVCRVTKQTPVIVDLPFMSYQLGWEQALTSAGRVLKETGAQGVKLEGGYPEMAETVRRIVQAGIPVMGHVGLTPQSVQQLGFKQQGKSETEGDRILSESLALEAAGAFAIVLEHIPDALAARITAKLRIPTIGIGAGPNCDGQVLVTTDVLGLGSWKPPFAKCYVDLRQVITGAVREFSTEVRDGGFPG
jgi:3-methyl-2-oxobutanoate hydroxymethyltransferase